MSSEQQYQEIYEKHEWYGDATQGRCPGVRMIPEFKDWIQSRVLDLGCGRGHTVEALREQGFEADGIDQIEIHPGMRVGNICAPIEGMNAYDSVICIDCIEHLTDEQVEGLFANMAKVKRQAFSIHNGESTGTGDELHINKKPFDQWDNIIRRHFKIEKKIQDNDEHVLYLTRLKPWYMKFCS